VAAVLLDLLRRLALLAALLAPALLPAGVRASSVIVPDGYASIQAALNSRADTVFVRAGPYGETPTLFAQVVLKGIPGSPLFERPMVAALRIVPAVGVLPTIRIDEVDVAGPITIQSDAVPPTIVWFLSRLHGGITDVSASPKTAGITLRNCQVEHDAVLKTNGPCVIDRCELDNQLVPIGANCSLSLTKTEFKGNGAGFAVNTQGSDIRAATVRDNIVNGCLSGITLSTTLGVEMSGNLVTGCVGEGLHARGSDVRIERNTIERCGSGLVADAQVRGTIVGNTVARCSGPGMTVAVTQDGTITGNVVWGNAGDGISLFANPVGDSLTVRNNTSAFNGGAGFVSWCHAGAGARFELSGNIGMGNHGYGMQWGFPDVSLTGCNDWFGNTPGDVQGRPPSTADIALFANFCSVAASDFHLSANSPLVNWPGCGLIGALGVGCSATTDVETPPGAAFRLDRVGPSPTSGPVRIEFELAQEAEIQLEIFDVQGRLAASLARGVWPAGRHVVEWSRAGPGIYAVRYRHPGGQDSRLIVRR
jgi:hypothetical protein